MCMRVTHKYTCIHLQHTNIHTLTCRQTQAFNLPFVTCTYTHTHLRACTHTNIHRCTHTLKRFLRMAFGYEKAWYNVLGQAWHIRWGLRLECVWGGRGGGDKVVGMQLHVYIHRAMCMCVVEICRSYTCRPSPFAELVTCTHTISCFPTTGVLRLMQL